MKAPLIHVASLVFNEPLAILPKKLEAILAAVGPRLIADDAALDELLQGSGSVVSGAQIPDQNGNRQEEKPYRLTPEGVAVIPVRGTLMKRFSWMSMASGCSSYLGLQQAAAAALADPQVKGVLFDVDSPGGSTHGCFELSDALYEMRGDKPMWAIANDLAASAAYALASAADRVLVTRTAGVGSIGVFALHADQSGFDAQAGVKFTYVYAGDKKTDGNPHAALSKSARADIQAEVDREYAMFVSTVARNRGFAGADAEAIQKTEAEVFFGENATGLLADEVSTLDEALEALTAKVNGSKLKSSGKVALKAEAGHNAPNLGEQETEKAKEPKGEEVMPKGSEDMKRAKAEDTEAKAAAEPEDDEDDDDKKKPEDDEEADARKSKKSKKAEAKDDEDDDDMPTKKGSVTELPVAANAPAKQIAELCQIAGAPELAADYIMKGYTVDRVIEKLSARRAKASAENAVSSYVTGESHGTQMSVEQAIQQANTISANSGGMVKPSQALERLLRGNPEIYEGYMNERDDVIARSPGGRGPALSSYVLGKQRRYMSALGLGTAVEDVPAHRQM